MSAAAALARNPFMVDRFLIAALATLTMALAPPVLAQDARPATQAGSGAVPKGYPAVPLLSTGTTILGEPIRYPTTGPAHVTASIIALSPGGRTIAHKHGVPLFAYILEGELTVDYGARGVRTYRAGDTFMEAMDVTHFGENRGSGPVRLLAVYMGAKGASDVIAEK
jgi:quercetin dioxygenase-like cupin family protein